MDVIKLSDVKIEKGFLKSRPNKRKITYATNFFEKYGRLDKPIVLNDGVLVDGYTRYLVAQTLNLEEVPYVELQRMTYVIGKFKNNNKEYIWKNDRNIDIDIGDKVLVKVKRNEKIEKIYVTVADIFSSDELELYNKHRSVIKNTSKAKKNN